MNNIRALGLALCVIPLFVAAEQANDSLNQQVNEQNDSATLYQRYQIWLEDTLLALGADGQYDPSKGIDWSVMPGPFYTPEKSFGIGVSAVGLYQVDADDHTTQPSSFTLSGFGSVNGAYGVHIENVNYFSRDQYRLAINAQLVDSPDIYYGIGMDAGINGQREDYNRRTYGFSVLGQYQILSNTYLGAGFNLSSNTASETQLDADSEQSFPQRQTHSGVTVSLAYDSRDFALNATQGRLVKLDYTQFDQAFGSDNDFYRLEFVYSDYLPIAAFDDVLAWQLKAESNVGDVSWDQMALLGGAAALRGYEEGRYRDKNLLMMQVEYRQSLAGRHGMVYWAGAGTLADEFNQLGDDPWRTTLGVGYRFEIKKNVNLRLDYGLGNDESGFYFAINEAF
ncbi:BamA/TamA family outer membrane protein [Vibrio hippocampi]|uniref:Outer membrane protein assembly factor BamA n=1 Tax=Vibrio hippocampi TaxID=654686 RepID=A0ABN8DJM7_9VIBR|nr:BamA/TamA family outer membrane protein [Vibrio hippocampi]CAH0529507.1 Outer membrane protein assembly factor BamA [Vibrio hippocampi]